MSFQVVEVIRSFEQVVQQIEEQIRRGLLPRGRKLPAEQELARQFGVSRSVVREAIAALATVGLVESRKGSGTYVRNDPTPTVSRALVWSVAPDDRSLFTLFEFRELLEVDAARLAAERHTAAHLAAIRRGVADTAAAAAERDSRAFGVADWALHAAIGEASDNPYLAVALNAVREMQRDVVKLVTRQIGAIAVAAEQHARIADAIAAGAADAAAAAMREHIRYSAAMVYQALAEMAPRSGDAPAAAGSVDTSHPPGGRGVTLREE